MMYRSTESSPQDSRDGIFCTVPRPHFLGRALIWPGCFGEHILGLFGLYPPSLSKSVRFVSLSEKASLVSISAAILFLRSWHVYFPLELKISWKKLCWMRACRRKWHLVFPTLYIINCRVSFIDLYLVFPRNFRMIFLPHTNTLILLEPYCGTITEPGLPVFQNANLRFHKIFRPIVC